MSNPSPAWDRVPVYGWYQKITGEPDPGQIRMSINQRVTRVDGSVIYAGGDAIQGTIGSDAMQDVWARETVRQALRDKAEAEQGDAFDGSAWDAAWSEKLPCGIFLSFPASDDPDIVQTGYQVKVEEKLISGAGKIYYIEPLLAHLDLEVPGINLGLVDVPPGSPTAPAPIYAKGLPGGVAALDQDGDVVNAAGEKVTEVTDASTAALVSNPATTTSRTLDDSYAKRRRLQTDKRRSLPGALSRVDLPTTGAVGGGGFGWTGAPIRIFRDGHRYITDFDAAAFKNTDPDVIYVDPVNGSNSNDGSSEALAKKTVNAGVTAVDAGGTVIVLGKGVVYRSEAFNGSVIAKSVNIVAEHPGEIAFAMSDNLAWSAGTGDTYTATRSNVSTVVDMGVGEHGLRYHKATSAEECQNTPGSWFQDDSTLHMHTLDGSQPDNQRHLALLKVQGWTVQSNSETKVYLEGLKIIGGEVNGNIGLSGTGPLDLVLKDVDLLYASDPSHNSLNAIGSGVRHVFLQNVTAHGSRKDGLNYSGANCRFIEVNCHSYGHGLDGASNSYTNNATTAHAGAKGIRIGGAYHETTGAVIADVQAGTQSVNYSCVAYDPLSGTGDLYDAAFCAQQAGASMWAFGCEFFGSGGWDSVAVAGSAVLLDETAFDTRTGADYTTVTNPI